MPLDAATFEKLGMFYLGRVIDPATREPTDAPLLLDSRDLVTHAVCVGMTGSGKTGLGIALLEEAAIDGVPALILDPKGDLANLALPITRLSPEEFQPWIEEGDSAGERATQWREGLAAWGQDAARIERLRASAEVTVFTPGSTAGQPLSVLASFDAPAPTDDAELFAERVDATAAALLALAGVAAGEVTSREHTLLAAILGAAWRQGESLPLEEIVRRVQTPPFASVGVLDVEAFFPAKERFQLVLALNNLLAAPGLAAWKQGAPLDVASLLWTPEGRPRLAVLSLAHLGDAERMFFVSLLLNAVVAWMRAQTGTTSLRALLYFDEVLGYFPPVANPPSKRPLLTLLKQARAFGLGVVLCTQNPADLDYKGLANAGTWLIGRLQTERDRARLLDGLGDAGAADREQLAALLADPGRRRFVLHSVHEAEPVLFETRWTLTFLRGPLTREQIRALTPPKVAAEAPAGAARGGAPVLKDIVQRFERVEAVRWRPGLLVTAAVAGREEGWFVPFAEDAPAWEDAEPANPRDFVATPPAGDFEALPAAACVAKSYAGWSKDAGPWVREQRAVERWRCAALKLESEPGETEREFRARVALRDREARDARADQVRARFAKRAEVLAAQARRSAEAVTREEAQAGAARWQTALSVGATVLGAFLGRKAVSAATLGRATTAARGVGRAVKESGDVGAARARLAEVEAQREALETELKAELAALAVALGSPEISRERVALPARESRVRAVELAWRAA